MKNKEYLTVRQEELMNFLWRVNEPMTANEMAEKLEMERMTKEDANGKNT